MAESQCSLGPNSKLVVALSGGVDSVVLLHLLAHSELRDRLRAIHVNHQLQSEAGAWAQFCQFIGEQFDVAVDIREIDLDDKLMKKKGVEAAAREARYKAITEAAGKDSTLLTAHHAGDQIETILFRMERGAGIKGLTGIPRAAELPGGNDQQLIRPLLPYSKLSIKSYAQNHDLEWVEDPSNLSADFRRNFYRQHVVPQLSSHLTDQINELLVRASVCERGLEERNASWLLARGNDMALRLEKQDFGAPNLLGQRLGQWLAMLNIGLPTTVKTELLRQLESGTALGKQPTYSSERYAFFVKRHKLSVQELY